MSNHHELPALHHPKDGELGFRFRRFDAQSVDWMSSEWKLWETRSVGTQKNPRKAIALAAMLNYSQVAMLYWVRKEYALQKEYGFQVNKRGDPC